MDINLHLNTLVVLMVGTSLFVVASIVCASMPRLRFSHSRHAEQNSTLYIFKWKLTAFLLFQILTCLLLVYYLISSFRGMSLQSAIYNFRAQSMFGYHPEVDYDISMPLLFKFFNRICESSGYLWAFLLARDIVYKLKKYRVYLILNLLLSIVSSTITTGGRKESLMILASFMVMYLLMRLAKNKWSKKVNLRVIAILLVVLFVFGFSFVSFGEFLGRKASQDVGRTLAVYLSAPLKNLDIYMQRGSFKAEDISHLPVLLRIIPVLSNLGLSKPYVSEMLYNRVHGKTIGNAYTTYYAYLFGFGYFGLIFFVVLNAVLCQSLFKRVKNYELDNGISVTLIIYSVFLANTMFSFFSDLFIVSVLATRFIWLLLTLNLLKWFICKDIKIGKIAAA